jgi:hypothetical protein
MRLCIYAAVRNAGFTVSKWYSVEEDEVCRNITETIVPRHELVHIGNRTDQVGNQIDHVKVDLFIDTSPCQPWSRCNGLNSRGFAENSSRSKTFTHANDLYQRLKITNPDIKHIVENVVPARHLKADQIKMEELYESKFTEINAKQWGAGHSRPRNLATNVCNLSTCSIPNQKPCDPSFFLNDENYCKTQVMKCIVVSDANTHSPPVVYSRANDAERRIAVVEAERLMLWPAGVTDGWCAKVQMGHPRELRM